MSGVITGGWPFVIAAYALTGTALVVYAVTLFARLRDAQSRAARENRP